MWLFPAQTTIFKETSWSEGFNEFSTPYRIPWICIIWTIFLEVIFPSGAQHFICMNASAWVIPASKLCMYKRGPGVWKKTYSIFLLFPVAYLGKVCVSFFRRKSQNRFHCPLGQRPIEPSQSAQCCALQNGQVGGLHPTSLICAVARDALWLYCIRAIHWLVWWIYGQSGPQLAPCAGIVELPWGHSLNHCFPGGYQGACGWTSVLPCAFISLISGLCPQIGVCSDSSKEKGNLGEHRKVSFTNVIMS